MNFDIYNILYMSNFQILFQLGSVSSFKFKKRTEFQCCWDGDMCNRDLMFDPPAPVEGIYTLLVTIGKIVKIQQSSFNQLLQLYLWS